MEFVFPLFCQQCDREFSSQGASQQHYRDSPVHRLMECEECDTSCLGIASLNRHMAEYHPPPFCSICDRTFVSEKAFQQHVSQSPAHRVFACKECGALCVGAAGLDKHTELCHPPPFCAECDRTFVSDTALQQHQRQSPIHKVLACDIYDAHCVGTAAFELHMEVYHPPPLCRECNRTFVSETALQQHRRESPIHKVFACDICDANCVGTAALDQHMETYHPPPHCALCDRDFVSEQGLQAHLQTSSAHLPTYECRECDRSFNTEAALRQHLRSSIHVHRCEDCGRTFASEMALQQHLNSPIHVHRCEECDRTFASEMALRQHLTSPRHLVRCSTCEQAFISRAALDHHTCREVGDLSDSEDESGLVPGTSVSYIPALGHNVRYSIPLRCSRLVCCLDAAALPTLAFVCSQTWQAQVLHVLTSIGTSLKRARLQSSWRGCTTGAFRAIKGTHTTYSFC